MMPSKKPVYKFSPAECIPFRDQRVLERLRRLKKDSLTKHPNPDFRISILPDAEIEFLWLTDMFHRIKTAADAGRPLVMIMPNPWPAYSRLARLINEFRVDCRQL